MQVQSIVEFARSRLGVEVILSPDWTSAHVTGVTTDQEAGRGDLAWVSRKTVATAPARVTTFGGTVLVAPPEAIRLRNEHTILIATEQPRELLAEILAQFFSDVAAIAWPTGPNVVAPDARLGQRVVLAPGVVIGPRVVVGDDVAIGPNTCLVNTTVGNRVRIGANCSIGLSGYGYSRDTDGTLSRIPHVGRVVVEDDVEIGSNTCIDRGTLGSTRIGSGAKIDNQVHVAHNCNIGPSALLIANSMIGGSTTIGARAWVAPSTAINNKLTIGEDATVGTGAVVIRDVPPAMTVVGNPAKPLPPKAQ